LVQAINKFLSYQPQVSGFNSQEEDLALKEIRGIHLH